MKKIFISFMAICLLGLSACTTTASAKVSDSETVIISAKTDFTKQDLFEFMKYQDYSAVVAGSMAKKIALLEGSTEDDLEKRADELLSQYEAVYTTYFQQIVENYGGMEIFKENLSRSAATEDLVNNYIDLKIEDYKTDYNPIKAQIAYFDDSEIADNFIERVENGEDFAEVAGELGYTLDAGEKVYTDKDSLALEVKEYINNSGDTGLSTKINTATTTTDSDGNSASTPRYYVINIIDRNVDNFIDDFKETIKPNIDTTEVLNYYFEKYNIQIHDQRTYDLLSNTYTGLK